jgi:hypothetical protein
VDMSGDQCISWTWSWTTDIDGAGRTYSGNTYEFSGYLLDITINDATVGHIDAYKWKTFVGSYNVPTNAGTTGNSGTGPPPFDPRTTGTSSGVIDQNSSIGSADPWLQVSDPLYGGHETWLRTHGTSVEDKGLTVVIDDNELLFPKGEWATPLVYPYIRTMAYGYIRAMGNILSGFGLNWDNPEVDINLVGYYGVYGPPSAAIDVSGATFKNNCYDRYNKSLHQKDTLINVF